MGRILLEGLEFFAYHGVNPRERRLGRHFCLDLAVEVDLTTAGDTDRLGDTVDYTALYRVARQVLTGTSHALLESVARDVALKVAELPGVQAVTVRLAKKTPPVAGPAQGVIVEVRHP